jgi:DNA-binding transcriptional LysR family regulator
MLSLRSELEATLSGRVSHAGIIRIGVAETLVHTLLGGFLRQLHRHFPDVTPEVTVEISPALQTMLLTGELDLAMLLGPVNEPRVHNVLVADYELVWVASRALGLGDATLSLAELARWPILSYSRGTLPHAQLTALFSRPDLPAVRIYASSSLASIIRMAVDGIGIGVVPHAVARAELDAGRLRLLAADASLPPLRFTASFLATPVSGLAAAAADLAGPAASGT